MKLNSNRDAHSYFSEGVHSNKQTNKLVTLKVYGILEIDALDGARQGLGPNALMIIIFAVATTNDCSR